ncbi:DUF3313 domain-containing protein [Achromobacter insolitus]|uniref:DUF3313 domain-containing protein n=1 Tax=Achromobacter insolitus TaxID=217204 RepID=UPI0011EAB3CC|nr:DUF3313 domain-containing protein [Achromobacter insolitus]QEK95894.1 DUF3313 domain-containing protein [Achromobacter insolitus]
MRAKGLVGTLFFSASVVFLVGGCAPTAPRESGFLPDYAHLTEQSAPGGGTRLQYVNPDFSPARYTAVWLEPVIYYPDPQPSGEVSGEALTQIRRAVDATLRRKVGQEVKLVDHAGPGVARIRIALTAIGTATQSLEAYQYIPIALVMTGAQAALNGGMPRNATVAIESRVTDSMSGELLYASVRGGTGERVASMTQGNGGVRLSDLQPLIDEWTTGAASEIRKHVRTR